ncbi:unnamed protein product, partial [Allacma fusca]
LGEKSLVSVALDLFQAGSMTTSTMLTWAVLYNVVYPEVQEKLQKEIDDVIGNSRSPSIADRPKPKPTLDPVPVFDVLEPEEFYIIVKDRRETEE